MRPIEKAVGRGTLDYTDRLIAALMHPLAEVRMRAIITLGWRGDGRAAQPLLDAALGHPVDVVEGLAIVDGLAGLGATGHSALGAIVERHPAHAVREAALRRLRELRRVPSVDLD